MEAAFRRCAECKADEHALHYLRQGESNISMGNESTNQRDFK